MVFFLLRRVSDHLNGLYAVIVYAPPIQHPNLIQVRHVVQGHGIFVGDNDLEKMGEYVIRNRNAMCTKMF